MEPLDQYILARTAELTTKIRDAYDDFEFHRAYHALNEYVNTDLSALYLDVLKDRLYTFAPDHPARRSAQTALWKIAEALTRLIAPILSFTADEVWQLLPKVKGREASVHLALFPDLADIVPGNTTKLMEDWEQLLTVRGEVLASLEIDRKAGKVGKGLDGAVQLLTGDASLHRLLTTYQGTLAELFNVSQVTLSEESGESQSVPLGVTTIPVKGHKCERCWRYTEDIGRDARFPTVCLRCAEALEAIGFAPYAAQPTTESQA
jgi:isoleucyl-tRNA synthetase